MSATTMLPSASEQRLPLSGHHRLNPDRCVVELSRRVLGVPVARARVTATGGELVVTDAGSRCDLDLRAASLRTGVPLLGRVLIGERGLDADNHPTLRFASEHVAIGPERRLRVPGSVTVRGEPKTLTLRGLVAYYDAERLVVWARGRAGRVHVEVAAEFVR